MLGRCSVVELVLVKTFENRGCMGGSGAGGGRDSTVDPVDPGKGPGGLELEEASLAC